MNWKLCCPECGSSKTYESHEVGDLAIDYYYECFNCLARFKVTPEQIEDSGPIDDSPSRPDFEQLYRRMVNKYIAEVQANEELTMELHGLHMTIRRMQEEAK